MSFFSDTQWLIYSVFKVLIVHLEMKKKRSVLGRFNAKNSLYLYCFLMQRKYF